MVLLPVQHTPKPDAQEPEEVPPVTAAHSAAVMHVPLKPLEPTHSVLAKRTIENNEKLKKAQSYNSFTIKK